MLTTMAIRKSASPESTSAARWALEIAKFKRYRVAPSRAAEEFPSGDSPITEIRYAVVATKIEFTIRNPKSSGSHVPVCPFARASIERARKGARTRKRKGLADVTLPDGHAGASFH